VALQIADNTTTTAGLDTNVPVVRVFDAARRPAQAGRTITLTSAATNK